MVGDPFLTLDIYNNHVTSVALFSVLVPEILVFVC